jgi:hypothetical protein
MPQIIMDTVVASPSAPSAGKITLYVKADNLLWMRLPDGSEHPISTEGFALLDSPIFVGDPRAPTPPTPDNDTSIATTAFVKASIGTDRPFESDPPLMDGVASPGTDATVARGDHVHPTDTSRASLVHVDTQDALLQAQIDTLNADDAFNVKKTSDTGSAKLPAGSDAQRDPVPEIGAIRFSSTQLGWEGWNGTNWVSIGGGQMLGQALIKGIFYNAIVIAEDLTIKAGTNGGSFGPVEVANGKEVTVENGSVWSIV